MSQLGYEEYIKYITDIKTIHIVVPCSVLTVSRPENCRQN